MAIKQSASSKDSSPFARRSFIKDGGLIIAGGAIAGGISSQTSAHADDHLEADAKPIRIGFLGCGRRAKELANSALGLSGFNLQVAVLADRFGSQTQSMYRMLKGRHAALIADDCIRANGQDCQRQLLAADVDVVYLATPPVGRADAIAKLVDAGKHLFIEKPLSGDLADIVALNPVAQRARQRSLTVHVGFQRRYDRRFIQSIEQLRQGLIGDPVFAKAYCNGGPLRKRSPQSGDAIEDYRVKNWNHFLAEGGDFLVEQHVAGLDLIHHALGKMPLAAQGQGGWSEVRAAMEGPQTEVFDHQTVEYDFGDVTLLSQCRRVARGWNALGESIHGTKGTLDLSNGQAFDREGNLIWKTDRPANPKACTDSQQRAFFTSIRDGLAENQIESAAQSTLIAILGQQATLTKRRVRLDKMLSQAITELAQA
ncbi:Gfo/Idh/MocA family protein [Roseiconus lacunae]|uniref:Gfo/Idh/MocA family protein n=1 Tax=Roseiconus lacunae TaxID=2605694 RepID=UPI001E521954|nr:Gfo/Idh/MocA family oxidoreductase [Roseiconus lacunae]MCD0459845.1 Gfo/Idh/MocA family oxidoreductase [Roseiconus lacunae]